MEIGCNQLKGGAVKEKLLTKIKKALLKDPESDKLMNQYTNERRRLLEKHHMDNNYRLMGQQEIHILNEPEYFVKKKYISSNFV